MKNKPTYLCLYGYHRENWIKPLAALDDQVELVFLFHIKRSSEKLINFRYKVIYWEDYNSAQELMTSIRPQKVVFMSIDSPLTLAVNSVAKQRGIQTIYLQHGLLHSLSLYDEVQKRGKPLEVYNQNKEASNRAFILNFFLKSLRFYNLQLFSYQLNVSFLERSNSKAIARSRVRSSLALADKYIVYTKSNAQVLIARDGVKPEQLIEVGTPEFDEFFSPANTPSQSGKQSYIVLIDYPMAEVKEFNNQGAGYSKEEVNLFYQALADFAATIKCRLKIKLHPYSYSSDFMLDHPNIDYVRHAELKPLIMGAFAIFGAASSLMLPAIYFKPVVLIDIFQRSDFAKRMAELGVCTCIPISAVIEGGLSADMLSNSKKNTSTFVRDFLYKTDGLSLDRTKQALLE